MVTTGKHTSPVRAGRPLFLLPVVVVLCGALTAVGATDQGEEHQSTGERIAVMMKEWGLSPGLIVVIISALPIVELRGAIPVAHLLFHMNPWLAYALAVVGNMVPVVPLLLFLGPASRVCMRVSIGKRFFDWFFERARRKSAKVEKYETFGLSLFVAIPLPVTGAWTGCAVAFLMGIRFTHALWAILLGVMISGTVMTAISIGITSFGWWGLIGFGAVVLGLVLYRVLRTPPAPEPQAEE
jgi:uncharacterized membrane protein